jgi:tetratricopeptide (TPR) repeat protein
VLSNPTFAKPKTVGCYIKNNQTTMKRQIITTFLLFSTFLTTFGQDIFLTKGNDFLNNGELKKAEKSFRKGIKTEPTNLIYQCQLGLTLIEQKKFTEAENVLKKVIKTDSNNVASYWYSGIGNFTNRQDRNAIARFEKALTLIDKTSGQYFAANWYIGKSYSILLQTDGLSYKETDRMFECYEEYLRLQPNAEDAEKIREYVDRKKKRRPPSNVKIWVDL